MSPPRYQVLSPSLASGSLAPSGLVRYPLCGGTRRSGNALKLCRKSPSLHRCPAPATPPVGLRGSLSKPPPSYTADPGLSTALPFQNTAAHPQIHTITAFHGHVSPKPPPRPTTTAVNDFPLPSTASTSPRRPKSAHFSIFFKICDKNRISIQLYI